MTEILFKDECYQVQGAIFDVYKEMGCGFLEAVYQEILLLLVKFGHYPKVNIVRLAL